MKYLLYIYLVNNYLLTNSFIIKSFDNAIGNWKLLYTDNPFIDYNIEKNKIDLSIYPALHYNKFNNIKINNIKKDIQKDIQKDIKNKISKEDDVLFLQIKRYEYNNLFTLTKNINCNIYDINCLDYICNTDNINSLVKDNKISSLVILNTQKSIKSIGIFELAFNGIEYKSEMKPNYYVQWRVDNILNRLYIEIDKNTYVFEKIFYDNNYIISNKITINTFLLSNLISFLLYKIFEKIFM
jgi:hypothetical protein